METLNYENVCTSNLLVEQHIHGCFGVDFSTCDTQGIIEAAQKLLTCGIGGFFPTLVTDSIENLKRQTEVIKKAKSIQTDEMADILGIHLEAVFLNPEKKGIHNEKHFLKPTIENYKLIEDEFIKIVTLAPELDENNSLQRYLTMKGVKVQAGHCTGSDLSGCHGVTHLFNAMSGINHRQNSTALSALLNDKIYTEIIADGIHLNDDTINLVFKCKPKNKIMLISDSLPITKSNLKEMNFAGETIYYKNGKATSKQGTIAGSTTLVNDIVKRLSNLYPDKFESIVKMASDNIYMYHEISPYGQIWWNENFNILAVEKNGIVLYKEN